MRKLTTEEFIERCKLAHNDKYDYKFVNYTSSHGKISIVCPVHGQFLQTAHHHVQGRSCPKCASRSTKNCKRLTTREFIQKARQIHGDRYDYSQLIYAGNRKQSTFICEVHGTFTQMPRAHLSGQGCKRCSVLQRTRDLNDFIQICKMVHGNLYDYTNSLYGGSFSKIKIVCLKHGEFNQLAYHHVQGHGCPNCTSSISKVETAWLDQLGIRKEFRNKILRIGKVRIKPDAFDPNTNTVYEFYGDFYHGNPKIFRSNLVNPINKKMYGELYSKTIERELLIRQAGYKLITIWENEFRAKKAA